jgi:PASTA domain
VKSFVRRGNTARGRTSGRPTMPRNFAVASMIAVVGALSLSVSALAAQTATDLPTQSGAYNAAWQPSPTGYTPATNDGLGVTPGKIGHVWVIVLENHAYESSFTPLEGTQSSYLQQLPNQGALLTHYYGTGHSSLDNYVSMVSGQAPQADDQSDCSNYAAMDGSVDTSGTPATNADFGQLMSNAGPDAPPGDNGCVYPSSVNTIFNQLDTANKTWKEYAQDLGGGTGLSGGSTLVAPHANQDAGATSNPYNAAECGAPDAGIAKAPDQAGSYTSPSTGSGSDANTNFASTSGLSGTVDSYVAKHNPLPWFSSLTGTADTAGTDSSGTVNAMNSTECNTHLGALFGPNDQLYNDLQSVSTTPDLSFISPDNCSDGHDAICIGNNLSGGTSNGFTDGSIQPATNDTGGTAAESSFLSIVVPEIEASPAFKQNGMIVVTYDEAYPAFTYSSDSQASSQLDSADEAGSLAVDSPGETLYGRSLNWEPTGPNATVVKSAVSGQVLSGGPGDDAYVDLPNTNTATGDLVACPTYNSGSNTWQSFNTPSPTNGKCSPGYQADGYYPNKTTGSPTTIHLDVATGNAFGTTLETETPVSEVYAGAQVDSVAGTPVTTGNSSTFFTFPTDGNNGNVYLGQVTASPNAGDSTSAPNALTSQAQFVDNLGAPLTAIGSTLGSQVALTVSDASSDTAVTSNDPFFDAYDPTQGGGDAGAVVISPYVTPGTVSNSYYNHYALLRTLEDVFGEQSNGTNTLTGGIVPDGTTGGTPGDTSGPYLGFASQPGLAPFGHDVFGPTNTTNTVTNTITNTVTQTQTQTQTQTVTTPGGTNTVTVPGPTRTVTKVKAIVPQVVGATLSAAKKAITTDGLKVGTVKGKSGVVASTSPRAGSKVAAGTKVTITLKAKK